MFTDYIWGESFTNLKSYIINEIRMTLEIIASYFKVIPNIVATSRTIEQQDSFRI